MALVAAAGAVAGPVRAAEQVDLLLVLASDVSRSVDAQKFQLQRDGYASAFSNARVLDAITSGRHGRIAVCFVEWSGATAQKLVIGWTMIKDAETARQFGDRLVEAPRSFAERTSISAGIDFAMAQFATAPFEATRRTIDVSGDGTNNSGRDVRAARDDAVAKDVTINGLVILSERPLSWNPEHTHPPGGLGELLPRQRHRRRRGLRHGGGELRIVRQGADQQADRRDRARPAGAACAEAVNIDARLSLPFRGGSASTTVRAGMG